MAESNIQKKMSSLSSRSIRHKPSAILSGSTSNPSSHQHHSSVSSSTQLLNSNTPTYARSIAEEDGSMLCEPTSNTTLNHPSATTPPSNSNSSTNNISNSASSTSTSSTTTTNTVESLLALAHKRITTLVYIKKVHEGKVHWFNTILLSRPELEKWFDHQRMMTRTTKFAILGLSLSSLLDINNLQDFLKAMVNLLQEFESIPNDNFKPKITGLSKGIFKQSSKSARKSAGGTDYSITLQDAGDPSFIYTPNIPFDLDYFEVWITLSDMLVEVYQKMIKFITTSMPGTGTGAATTTTTTTTATTATTVGSSSSTSPVIGNPVVPASLAGPLPPALASGGQVQPSVESAGPQTAASIQVPPPPPTRSSSNYSIVSVHQTFLNHHHIDLISRIDSKLKKLIVILTKEIDAMARAAIRDELANLDPMLLSSSSPSPSANPNPPATAAVSPDFSPNVEWD